MTSPRPLHQAQPNDSCLVAVHWYCTMHLSNLLIAFLLQVNSTKTQECHESMHWFENYGQNTDAAQLTTAQTAPRLGWKSSSCKRSAVLVFDRMPSHAPRYPSLFVNINCVPQIFCEGLYDVHSCTNAVQYLRSKNGALDLATAPGSHASAPRHLLMRH